MPEELSSTSTYKGPTTNTLGGVSQLKPPSEVDSELSRQSTALNHLINRLGVLAEMLQPILDLRERPQDPSDGGKATSPASSLAVRINHNTSQVDVAIGNVDDIVSRLTI